MKKFLLSILTLTSIQAFAQEVLVSHPSYNTSHLAMNGDVKGFHLPNVALVDVASKVPFENVTEGLLVYNTNPDIVNGNGKGIYIYINNKWIRSGENADHYLIKDYKQKPLFNYSYSSNFEISNTITIGNKTFTKEGNCEPRYADDYAGKYCLFTTNQGVSWTEAYALTRNNEVNGYLPIVTTEAEQQNLEAFLTNKGVTTNIWLGTRKLNHSNTANVENEFITPNYQNFFGKSTGMKWSNRPQKYHNFLESEPDNTNRSEGCLLMLGANLGTNAQGILLEKNKWIDVSCSLSSYIGNFSSSTETGEITKIVVELGN